MKVIVLTGGGTSGHVTPNIALIPKLRALGHEIHYIGSKNGLEKQLIEKEAIPYYGIDAGKLRRYADLKNLTDIFRIVTGFRQAFIVLKRIKPDVVFSKGGFVSCPVVWASWVRRIPVVVHESDITPGLTNRLSIPFAKKICYTFPETANHIPADKAVFTGLPIRDEVTLGDRLRGIKLCSFSSVKPVIVIMGGSQGSESINKEIRKILNRLLCKFQICHLCGKDNIKPELDVIKGYKQFEYINKELPDIFACADIIISRAGATTLFEILALKKPALLIPLTKNASRGDQILNAKSFQENGFSDVLYEENLTCDHLMNKINNLYEKRNAYIKAMSENLQGNAVDKIIELILKESIKK